MFGVTQFRLTLMAGKPRVDVLGSGRPVRPPPTTSGAGRCDVSREAPTRPLLFYAPLVTPPSLLSRSAKERTRLPTGSIQRYHHNNKRRRGRLYADVPPHRVRIYGPDDLARKHLFPKYLPVLDLYSRLRPHLIKRVIQRQAPLTSSASERTNASEKPKSSYTHLAGDVKGGGEKARSCDTYRFSSPSHDRLQIPIVADPQELVARSKTKCWQPDWLGRCSSGRPTG